MVWGIVAAAAAAAEASIAASNASVEAYKSNLPGAEGRARSRSDMSNWIRQPMRSNCVNCGAPIEALCSYCGTPEPLGLARESPGRGAVRVSIPWGASVVRPRREPDLQAPSSDVFARAESHLQGASAAPGMPYTPAAAPEFGGLLANSEDSKAFESGGGGDFAGSGADGSWGEP